MTGGSGAFNRDEVGGQGAPWWAPLECPVCHATDGKCEHTFDETRRRAVVLTRLWDLSYQHGQSVTFDVVGGRVSREVVYLGGLRIAEGPDWMEQVMAFPKTPAASSDGGAA